MSNARPYPGFFITLEGGDGSGKSTLAKSLGAHFKNEGYSVILTREPGGSELATHLRGLLLDPNSKIPISEHAELFLFLAARAQHIDEVIMPHLREGAIVICERFNDSTIAYQGCARHLGLDYVTNLCHLATQSLEPDSTLLLDIDPDLAFLRIKEKKDRMEMEAVQFHREVRSAYLHLADQFRDRILILDATLPKEELLKAALATLKPHLLLKPALAKH